jgi:P2 family phage contractile tail tube protein
MSLIKTLKNFNVFNDAVGYMGVVEEVKLPKLTRKMEDFRGGGMNAPLVIDLGNEELEAELTLGGIMKQVFDQYAATKVGAVQLRFAGAYQDDETGIVQSVEVVMRGRWSEIDPGDSKAGERTKHVVKAALAYYKLSIDSVVAVEIDVLNMIENVNGTDMLAEQRKAIGLA